MQTPRAYPYNIINADSKCYNTPYLHRRQAVHYFFSKTLAWSYLAFLEYDAATQTGLDRGKYCAPAPAKPRYVCRSHQLF
jgi:hypothetical protein